MNGIDAFRAEVKSRLLNLRCFDWREEIPSLWVEEWRQELVPKTRQRLWTVELMLWFWLLAGLHREKSFRAVTTEVWASVCADDSTLAKWSVNEGRMAEGRARVPLQMIRRVREEFGQRGAEEGRGLGLWHGHRVVWVDGTTISLADLPPLREHFGSWSNQHGNTSFPLARLVIWGIAATRIVIGAECGPSFLSEKEFTLRSLPCLRLGDLAVMDRNFASAELFAQIKRRGGDALTRVHPQFKLSKHPHRRLRPHEWIVEMPLDPDARKRDASLPPSIQIRVLHVRLPSGQNLRLQTTLLDPDRYAASQLAELYLQRWGVETSYAEVKQDLHLAVVRSTTIEGVYKEVEAHVAAYNYVRLMMVRAAIRNQLDPCRLSFRTTVRLLNAFNLLGRRAGSARLQEILWDRLLQQIASRVNPRRPGRHEPRAIKRRSSYHRWKGDRGAWRAKLMASH